MVAATAYFAVPGTDRILVRGDRVENADSTGGIPLAVIDMAGPTCFFAQRC